MNSLAGSGVTRATGVSRGISAIALFLVFLLGFVLPAISAGPAPEEIVAPQAAASPATSPEDSDGDTVVSSGQPRSEVCDEVLDLANTIESEFVLAANGSRGDLLDFIDSATEILGPNIYSGKEPVRQALGTLRIAAQGATSSRRTSQELTSAGLSSRLNSEVVRSAVAKIYELCR